MTTLFPPLCRAGPHWGGADKRGAQVATGDSKSLRGRTALGLFWIVLLFSFPRDRRRPSLRMTMVIPRLFLRQFRILVIKFLSYSNSNLHLLVHSRVLRARFMYQRLDRVPGVIFSNRPYGTSSNSSLFSHLTFLMRTVDLLGNNANMVFLYQF